MIYLSIYLSLWTLSLTPSLPHPPTNTLFLSLDAALYFVKLREREREREQNFPFSSKPRNPNPAFFFSGNGKLRKTGVDCPKDNTSREDLW
jgi:hypothetical protein